MGLFSWDSKAANNANSDPLISAQDGLAARSLPSTIRAFMAGMRRFTDDAGGALTTSGQLNAYVVKTNSGIAELRPGLALLVRADRDNTAVATLSVDGLGPLPWVDAGGVPLQPGRILKDRYYAVIYEPDNETWRVQAGASTLDEIPGLIDLRAAVAADASTVASNASSTSQDRAAVSIDRAATDSNKAAAQAARLGAEAARDLVQGAVDGANAVIGRVDDFDASLKNGLADAAIGFPDRMGGNTFEYVTPTGTSLDLSNRRIVIAAGADGDGALTKIWFEGMEREAAYAGQVYEFTVEWEATSEFLATLSPGQYGAFTQRQVNGVYNFTSEFGFGTITRIDPIHFKTVCQYTLQGGDATLGGERAALVFNLFGDNPPVGAERSFKPVLARYRRLGVSTNTSSVDQRATATIGAAETRSIDLIRRNLGLDYEITRLITVDPNGSGPNNYTTIQEAALQLGGRNALQRVAVAVAPGTYDLPLPIAVDVYLQDFSVWFAMAGPGSVVIRRYQPDNAQQSVIQLSSAVWWNATTDIYDLIFEVKNGRYAAHRDGAGGLNSRARAFRCEFRHLGNAGADAFYGTSVWGSKDGLGSGTQSGETVEMTDCTFIAPDAPYSVHNYVGTVALPSKIRHVNPKYINPRTNIAIRVSAGGSGKVDPIEIVNPTTNGGVIFYRPDLRAAPSSNQLANANVTMPLSIVGGDAMPVAAYNALGFTNAVLELRSTAAANSSVEILFSTARKPLFTDQPDYAPGDASLPASAFSRMSLYGANALGTKLGDCRTTPKVLSISLNGGASVNLSFAADYRTMTDAQVVSAANALLNAAVGAGPTFALNTTYYDRFNAVDHGVFQKAAVNSGATAILQGMACAFDGSSSKVRRMTSADRASLFAGIAKATIPVGRIGQMITPGAAVTERQVQFVYGAIAGQPASIYDVVGGGWAFGDGYGVDPANPGFLKRGAGLPLLSHVNVGDAGYVFRIGSAAMLSLAAYTVADLPPAGTPGRTAYATNARVGNQAAGAGTGALVTDNGTVWQIAGTNTAAAA